MKGNEECADFNIIASSSSRDSHPELKYMDPVNVFHRFFDREVN